MKADKTHRLLADLEKLLQSEVPAVPENFKTARQLATETGKDVRSVREWVAKLISAGAWEMKEFRIRNGGQNRLVPHYAPKKP